MYHVKIIITVNGSSKFMKAFCSKISVTVEVVLGR
jgi:hypothetical protein